MEFINELIFNNISETMKKVAKILFCLLLGGGVVILLIGFMRIIAVIDDYYTFMDIINTNYEDYLRGIANDYNWYVSGYLGKNMMKDGLYIILGSIATLPLYGIGILIDTNIEIKRKLEKIEQKYTEIE